MFYYCYKLTTVPLLDTSNVTDMSSMFYKCSALTTIPALNTSNVTSMRDMFHGCKSLTVVPQLDMSKVTDATYMFQECNNIEAVHMININTRLDLYLDKLTREAIVEVIGNLMPQTGKTETLGLGTNNLAKLTEEDKKVATDKGWILE